jgi:hypothetical protein
MTLWGLLRSAGHEKARPSGPGSELKLEWNQLLVVEKPA